jgi:hypothetical protein
MSHPPTPPSNPYEPEGAQPGQPAGPEGQPPAGHEAPGSPYATPSYPSYPSYPGQEQGGPSYPSGSSVPGYGAEPSGAPYPPPAPGPYGAPAPGPYGTPAPGPYGASPYPTGPGAYGHYPRNDLGIWALVLGIASFVLSCGFLTGIPAIIVGSKAKRAVEAGEANNGGLATAGVVLGWIATALSVVAIIFFVIVFAFAAANGDFNSDYYRY